LRLGLAASCSDIRMLRLLKLAALAAILLRIPQTPGAKFANYLADGATARLAALIPATQSKPRQDRANVTEDSE
jgi:hypothetical protein